MGGAFMRERVSVGRVSKYGENRHTKVWLAQWGMNKAYANVAPLKILTDLTFLKFFTK